MTAIMEPTTDTREDFSLAEYPYRFQVIPLNELFVDKSYQRELTDFVNQVARDWNPALVGTLVVSERTSGKKYAVVDGQTRKEAAEQIEVVTELPCLVYHGLSRREEARLFELLQTKRRGVKSYDRFRAALVGGNPETKAIKALVEGVGYEIGPEPKLHITAVSALEQSYRKNPEALERGLFILIEAWSTPKGELTDIPSGEVIRGMTHFLERNEKVDDERLVRRLKTVNLVQLKKRALAFREAAGGGSAALKFMAAAIEATYNSRS